MSPPNFAFLLIQRFLYLLGGWPSTRIAHQDCDGFVSVDEWTSALGSADLDSVLVDLQTAAELDRRQEEEKLRQRDAEEKQRVICLHKTLSTLLML